MLGKLNRREVGPKKVTDIVKAVGPTPRPIPVTITFEAPVARAERSGARGAPVGLF